MAAVLQSTKEQEGLTRQPAENDEIYKQFMKAKETGNEDLAEGIVKKLAGNYKEVFKLDNARNILMDLAKEYLQKDKLAEATDKLYGVGCAEYVAKAIQSYYGVSKG